MSVSLTGDQNLDIEGNIGPTVISSPTLQQMFLGDTLRYGLSQHVTNDDVTNFRSMNESFSIDGDSIQYIPTVTGTISIDVLAIDSTDPGLSARFIFPVEVSAPPDIIGPVINLPDTLYFNEGESLTLGLDSLATDNVTASGTLAWACTGPGLLDKWAA